MRSNEEDPKWKTTTHFSLINHIKNKGIGRPGVLGYGLNLSDVQPENIKTAKSNNKYSTRFGKFMKSKKIKEMPDPEKQFHENMILYKDSLPPFFKSTKYVLINKEGELLQEETEALRVHLSPNPEYLNEFEVPVTVNFNFNICS